MIISARTVILSTFTETNDVLTVTFCPQSDDHIHFPLRTMYKLTPTTTKRERQPKQRGDAWHIETNFAMYR